MITNQTKQIASKLGLFFLQEKGGNYDEACTEITKLRINRLEMIDGRLTIETSRPGRLIGERIEALQKYGVSSPY